MVAFKTLSFFAIASLVAAQAEFGAPENSADVLAALQAADTATVNSGAGALAYEPGNDAATETITNENGILLSDWQAVTTIAQSSQGFFSDNGSLAIISFVQLKLFPDTFLADQVYAAKRQVFIDGGFSSYIAPGLIKLRQAVAEASEAVQVKTPAKYLTPMTVAFLQIEQDYANVQEIQQFGYIV